METKLRIYMDYTNSNERQPNENKENNDNPRTKMIAQRKDGQIWVLDVVHLQIVDFWHFEKK